VWTYMNVVACRIFTYRIYDICEGKRLLRM
jgi:hypothetical protein